MNPASEPSKEYQVDEARRMGVCRICGEPTRPTTARITLNFGAEFAHTDCLKKSGEPTYEEFMCRGQRD